MFSPEKSERQKSTERLKYASGAQLFLGAGLFVCAIVAVTKQEDRYYNTYFIGGFTCGIAGIVAGVIGLYTSTKASSYNDDDVSKLQKELQCTACIQMIFGYIVFMTAISGIMMTILFLANDDDEDDDGLKIHVILASCILAGILLLLVATFFSFRAMGTCCRYQGYNQRMTRACPTTTGTTQYYQGQGTYGQPATHTPIYSTGGFNASSNPPPYPVSQSYSMGQQMPPPYGLQGTGQQQPTPYGLQGTGQQQPPPYGFKQDNLPTAPPPSYPY